MSQLALDIETVALTEDPDFNVPSDWSPFAIALAARSDPSATPTTRVILRESNDDHGARKLLAAATNWMQAAIPTTPDAEPTLLTFNGENFDIPIIEHVARETRGDRRQSQTLQAAVNRILDTLQHRDLFAELVEDQPEGAKWPTLAESCAENGVEFELPRVGNRAISGESMPELGRAVMDGSITEAERTALVKYARQDAKVLLSLERKMSENAKPKPEVSD